MIQVKTNQGKGIKNINIYINIYTKIYCQYIDLQVIYILPGVFTSLP